MWINSLYLWSVICSKNPCSRYLLFRWESSRQHAPVHTACLYRLWKTYNKCHNPLIWMSILPGTLIIPITYMRVSGRSVLKCSVFCITPLSPGLNWVPKAHRLWVWVSLTSNTVSLATISNTPKHPLCSQVTLFQFKIWAVSIDSARWGFKPSSIQRYGSGCDLTK